MVAIKVIAEAIVRTLKNTAVPVIEVSNDNTLTVATTRERTISPPTLIETTRASAVAEDRTNINKALPVITILKDKPEARTVTLLNVTDTIKRMLKLSAVTITSADEITVSTTKLEVRANTVITTTEFCNIAPPLITAFNKSAFIRTVNPINTAVPVITELCDKLDTVVNTESE